MSQTVKERENREAWAKRFQAMAKHFRSHARTEDGGLINGYCELQARRYYRQSRQIMQIEEGELN